MTRKRDELIDDHEADGIREFDNDLPRWWLYGFYLTIAIAVIYMVNFHVLPTPLAGAPSIAAEYDADVRAAAEAAAARTPAVDPNAAVTLLTDAESLEEGREIFESEGNVCASCHRPDLGGLIGPNLTDDKWMHGCSIGEVMASIRTGYPTRGMLPFGSGETLDEEKLRQLASYVLSKQGSNPPKPKPADAERDKACGGASGG
jgi:cytochrome c oxidase cbb3-type subunit 3